MKKTALAFILSFSIAAFAQEASEADRIMEEYGLTMEQYTELTNQIDSAIAELISMEVRYRPATPAERISVTVEKILAADLAKMTTVEVEALLAHATVDRTEAEIAEIYGGLMANATDVQIPKLAAAIVAQGTDVQIAEALGVVISGGVVYRIDSVMKAVLAEASEVKVAGILSASMVNSSSVQVANIVSAMMATHTEVEIKRIMAATYVSKTGISMLDYLDRTGFRWIIMRMKAARAVGNDELYLELQDQLIKSVNEWIFTEGVKPRLDDPELN